jgi:predicted RNase H-like nuclease (RuvC/YqgF family)
VQQLLDSVGRLNFSLTKLKETRKELRKLELRFDSLKLKNNFLRYNNDLLANRYNETLKQLEELRGRTSNMERTESLLRETNRELARELKVKSYLKLQDADGSGFRLRAGRPIKTNKASTIEKLRGCVTIMSDPNTKGDIKVLYLQFLDPNMAVIEDNANTVSVSGNTYSKKMEIVYTGKEIDVCDAITVPEGSLIEGIYTLNVFEDERLLASTEFQLK